MRKLKTCGKIGLILIVALLIILLAAYLFITFYPAFGDTPGKAKREEYEKRTQRFFDKEFHNELDFEVMTGTPSEKSERAEPEERIKVEKIDSVERAEEDQLKVIWLGHSSSLVQMGDQNIFIDPVLSERASPVGFAGPKRFSDLALERENVPDIDVLYISHDHYDHLDYETIRDIDSKVANYVVPLGIDVILQGWGVGKEKLHPLDWWESIEISGVTYTVVPSLHYTGRNPLKMNATSWGGLYIKNEHHSVYYTGDSGYYDVFRQVYERFGETELMLADSGQYDVGWATTHMFPEQSVQAAKEAHAKWLIPVHWGAFSLSNHAWDEPPRLVVNAAEEQGVNLATPRIGVTVDYEKIESFQEHWWEDYK